MFINLVSRSQEDGVVSVPSEGSVSSGVCSVVHMVRSGVRGGAGGSICWRSGLGRGTVITGIGKLRTCVGGGLVTVLLLGHPGLSGEAGVLDNREASEVGLVHAIGGLEVNHQVSGHCGGRGDCGAQSNKDLERK